MANMFREWLRLLVKRISGFVFGDFLVIEIVVAIYEPFVMHEFVELMRMTWHRETLNKRLLLPDSLGLHTQTIARHGRLCDAHKNVSASLAASRTWLPSFFHGACLNKLLSAVSAFGTVFERHSCDVQRNVYRKKLQYIVVGCPAKTRVSARPYSLVCSHKNSDKPGKCSSVQEDISPPFFLLWMHEGYRIPQTKAKTEGLQAAPR